MAPVSKGKVGLDHVKAFNVAVTEWKCQRSEKVLGEVERILAVLCKISDLSVFSSKNPEVRGEYNLDMLFQIGTAEFEKFWEFRLFK